MNSFIGWIGGKKLLRNTIMEQFPKDFERYIEVFGGAGWVLFGKESENHLEIFNDIDSNLINLYRCIKYHCGELQRELQWCLLSREQFFDSKEQMKVRGLTDIQRAARYLIIIKLSFGCDRRTFGMEKRNLPNVIDYLSDISKRLNKVIIENKDFENLIKVYDRPKALFYLDPPYVNAENYYDNPFTLQDHIRLHEILKLIKGKFLLSYNDEPEICDLYSDFNIIHVNRNHNLKAKEGERYREVIIKNY